MTTIDCRCRATASTTFDPPLAGNDDLVSALQVIGPPVEGVPSATLDEVFDDDCLVAAVTLTLGHHDDPGRTVDDGYPLFVQVHGAKARVMGGTAAGDTSDPAPNPSPNPQQFEVDEWGFGTVRTLELRFVGPYEGGDVSVLTTPLPVAWEDLHVRISTLGDGIRLHAVTFRAACRRRGPYLGLRR